MKKQRVAGAETGDLLTRILDASNARVIAAYEDKIAELEHEKARLTEKRNAQTEPAGSFEEKLEPAL